MKLLPILLASSLIGFASLPSAHGDVHTAPVGFVSFVPAPSVNGTTRKFTVGSFPLQGVAKWAGMVNQEPSGNTLVGKNATWVGYGPTAQGFVTHVIRFSSGGAVGRIFPISALPNSTTATVVLPTSVTNLGTSINADDTFEIIPVNTLKSVFGGTAATVKFQQSALQGSADLVHLWNGSSWIAYWFDGTKWISQEDEFSDLGNTPLLSDEGVWVARRSTGVIDYAISGTVPTGPSLALEVPGASGPNRKFTFLSNPFPTAMTIAGLNLLSLPNWQSAAVQGSADVVYLWNGAAWIAFWHDGSKWINQDDEFSSSGNTPVPMGSGVWVARRSSAPAGESVFSSLTRPYPLP